MRRPPGFYVRENRSTTHGKSTGQLEGSRGEEKTDVPAQLGSLCGLGQVNLYLWAHAPHWSRSENGAHLTCSKVKER